MLFEQDEHVSPRHIDKGERFQGLLLAFNAKGHRRLYQDVEELQSDLIEIGFPISEKGICSSSHWNDVSRVSMDVGSDMIEELSVAWWSGSLSTMVKEWKPHELFGSYSKSSRVSQENTLHVFDISNLEISFPDIFLELTKLINKLQMLNPDRYQINFDFCDSEIVIHDIRIIR